LLVELVALLKELAYDYFLLINIAGFILMSVDKASAIEGETRILKKWFFMISLIGGEDKQARMITKLHNNEY